jgi:phi13 family phage major tail protein
MAKIGYRYPRYCVVTEENGTETLSRGKTMAKGIKAEIKVNTSDAILYADDKIAEEAKEFISGTITQECDDVSDEVLSEILGHNISDGEIVASKDDVAPYCRVGFISRKIKDGTVTYKTTILMRVKYAIPDESYETTGEKVSLQSVTLTGTLSLNADNEWKRSKSFKTLPEAVAYLNKMVNMTISALTVTSTAGTSSGKTVITVSPAIGDGHKYMYKTGTSLVLPETDDICNTGAGYAAWDGASEIEAPSGGEIVVVEVDSAYKAVKAGKTSLTIKQ